MSSSKWSMMSYKIVSLSFVLGDETLDRRCEMRHRVVQQAALVQGPALGTLYNCCGYLEEKTMELEGGFFDLVSKAAGGRSSVPWLTVRGPLGIHSHASFSRGRTYFPLNSNAMKTD